MQVASLRPLAAFLTAILLTACQSQATLDPGISLQPLGKAGLRETLTSNTLSRSGGPFWQRWEYAGVHHDDGSLSGRVSWSGGQEVVSGVWEISRDGLYCRTWSNHWGDGKRGCFQASRGGEILVFDHVSGSGGDAERYVYRLLAGNPHDL